MAGSGDKVIMTAASNPEVMAVCYAQGWCASPERMYLSEAEAVTSLGTAFRGSDIVHFDELQHFTAVTSFSPYGFQNCKQLASIVLPPNVVGTLARTLFMGCTSLPAFNVPSGVTGFGDNITNGCTSLRDIYIEDLQAWCRMPFAGEAYTPFLTAKRLIVNGSEILDVEFPAELTELKAFAFYKVSNLRTLTLHDEVSGMGRACLQGCTSLAALSVPEGVTTMPYYGCNGCTSLTSVDLPASLTLIDYACFNNCVNLGSLTCRASVAPQLGKYALQNVGTQVPQGERKLYVPRGATGYDTGDWLNLQKQEKFTLIYY